MQNEEPEQKKYANTGISCANTGISFCSYHLDHRVCQERQTREHGDNNKVILTEQKRDGVIETYKI